MRPFLQKCLHLKLPAGTCEVIFFLTVFSLTLPCKSKYKFYNVLFYQNILNLNAVITFLITFVYIKLIEMISANIFLGMIGPWQIVIVVVLILLLFGGKKIPELMRGLGSGIKEFKDASKEDEEETKVDQSKK